MSKGSRGTETKRRTPTPAKMALAGENACEMETLEESSSTGRNLDTDKAYTLAKHVGEHKENIHGRNEPLCEPAIGILGLGELGDIIPDMLSKDGDDCIGRATGLKPGG
jgi:hypothetical protein